MKYLAILLLVVACTTKKEVTKTETPAGESSAKPVSPYTVEPCYCMKIFKPVCGADGKNYGNSCEAECQGNKTWKDGNCP